MKEKIDKRTAEVFNLEMTFDGVSFYGIKDYNEDFNIHATELMCDDDEKWNAKIKKMSAELERRKSNNLYYTSKSNYIFDIGDTVAHITNTEITLLVTRRWEHEGKLCYCCTWMSPKGKYHCGNFYEFELTEKSK